jgi:hypothetical protein
VIADGVGSLTVIADGVGSLTVIAELLLLMDWEDMVLLLC